MDLQLQELTRQVCHLAEQVGSFLREENSRFSHEQVEYKGYNNLVSYVDKEAEIRLVAGCKKILPQAAFLTEEGTVENEQEGTNGLIWVIDPLDGTTNFVHKLPMYSISIGLVLKGKPILGVVAHVPNREIYYAWEGGGAWCNGKPISVSPATSLENSLLATGFPYFQFEGIHQYLNTLHELMRLSHGLRRMGSAAIDLVYVASGIFEGFFEYNLSPWDVAAGICIVREAGGVVTDFSGQDNALFGRQLLAAGLVHQELLAVIKKNWNY